VCGNERTGSPRNPNQFSLLGMWNPTLFYNFGPRYKGSTLAQIGPFLNNWETLQK